MSFAARAQASHARLRAHFGSITATIRDGTGSGATTQAVTCSPPISHSLVSETGAVDDMVVKFDHSDPARTFGPTVGDPISWTDGNGFNGRVKEVHTHEADATIRYTLVCGGTR